MQAPKMLKPPNVFLATSQGRFVLVRTMSSDRERCSNQDYIVSYRFGYSSQDYIDKWDNFSQDYTVGLLYSGLVSDRWDCFTQD